MIRVTNPDHVGRCTSQVMAKHDHGYWSVARDLENQARDELVQGRRHPFEAQMRKGRRMHGHPAHMARPGSTVARP